MLASDQAKLTETDCVPKLNVLSVINILIIVTIEFRSHGSVRTEGYKCHNGTVEVALLWLLLRVSAVAAKLAIMHLE